MRRVKQAWLGAASVLVLMNVAWGDGAATGPATGPATLPADPMAESRKIDDAIKKLWEKVPSHEEMDQLSEKINTSSRQHDKDMEALWEQLQKLQSADEYFDFDRKRYDLELQRNDQWAMERKALGEAATRIYADRHAELLQHGQVAIPRGKALGFDVLHFPQLDGSTSTQPLTVILASRLLNIPYEWKYPEPTGNPWHPRPGIPRGSFLWDYQDYRPGNYEVILASCRVIAAPTPAAARSEQRIATMINSLLARNASTHDAYINLIEGKCDLNVNARPPSPSELKLAAEKHVKLGYVPIAKDALVFIVHRSNPLQNLMAQQIRDIYAEKVKLWRDVAADPKLVDDWKMERTAASKKEILPLWRERDSGSRELFDALVMKNLTPPTTNTRSIPLYANSMSGPYNLVTEHQEALGYSVYYYEHFMAMSPYTRTIAIDGVEPTAETIASGNYPLSCPVYAAYREDDPADSPGMKLLNWLLSDEGQSVIKESGYVPVR